MNSLIVVDRRWPDAVSVIGEMLFKGLHEAYTLEPPVAADDVKPRCTPAGTYDLTIRWSNRFNRRMPHVENVPGFSEIMLHWGNYPRDTEGCTVVGEIRGTDFVGHSIDEFDVLFLKIHDALNQGPQTITYIGPPEIPAETTSTLST